MNAFDQKRYFKEGKLANFPARRTDQIEVLKILVASFEADASYPEKEVNHILGGLIETRDPVFFRRELIDLGLLVRDRAGRAYARAEPRAWENARGAAICGIDS
jgi:hypothetical protein